MASFRVDGLDELLRDFSAIAELPDTVAEDMLNAEADVLVEAQKATAGSMLAGPYSKGITAYGLTKGKVQMSSGGKVLHITFKGTITDAHHKKPTRIAEIAFINEFGKEGQPSRPFIKTANEEKGEQAVQAAARVYDRFLKTKGF